MLDLPARAVELRRICYKGKFQKLRNEQLKCILCVIIWSKFGGWGHWASKAIIATRRALQPDYFQKIYLTSGATLSEIDCQWSDLKSLNGRFLSIFASLLLLEFLFNALLSYRKYPFYKEKFPNENFSVERIFLVIKNCFCGKLLKRVNREFCQIFTLPKQITKPLLSL